FLIDKLLKESNRALKDWPTMPLPERNWDEEVVNPLIEEQLDYNRDTERERAERMMASLNAEQ
ncbi:hypothetical protein C8R44DRAFT_585297, partial [Mycena epipterygia]